MVAIMPPAQTELLSEGESSECGGKEEAVAGGTARAGRPACAMMDR
jgi:hypothetical protein